MRDGKKKEKNGEHSKWFGGAIINATAFVGGSYLTKYVTGDQNSVVEERKRHDLAVEKYKTACERYEESHKKLLDWVAFSDRIKNQAGQNLTDTDNALKLDNKVHQDKLH